MKATVSATKALRRIELEIDITNVRVAHARMLVGVWLLRIAARTIGCGVSIYSRKPRRQ